MRGEIAQQRCLDPGCRRTLPVRSIATSCPACGGLLDVVYDWEMVQARFRGEGFGGTTAGGIGLPYFERPGAAERCSGVWQFRELLPFYWAGGGEQTIASIGEGKTILQRADALAAQIGLRADLGGALHLQYEGLNPSGSFKDNGMTAGFTHARMVGAQVVACASTGNTSASLAVYAARCGMRAVVFIGKGKIAYGKLSQALDYGATTLQIDGDFDACLARVRQIADDPDGGAGVYLLNSVNPFRLEGQKTIMLRVLRDLGWPTPADSPDWIIVPGGNLGNCAAFGKTFLELKALGLVQSIPRLAVINAAGASTLDRMYNQLGVRWTPAEGGRGSDPLLGTYPKDAIAAEYARMDANGARAKTIASAIEINRPVNLPKALRALWAMDGVVRSVSDDQILEHKALIGRHGLGCEPASAAALAGARRLIEEGIVGADQTVVCILTGHQLKDPDATVGYHTGNPGAAPTGRLANRPVQVGDDLEAILNALNR